MKKVQIINLKFHNKIMMKLIIKLIIYFIDSFLKESNNINKDKKENHN